MVEMNFYLSEEMFNKLADLKEKDPEFKDKSFNDFARELLETMIFIKERS